MIISGKTHRGRFFDAATGAVMPLVREYDTDSGRYEAYAAAPDGRMPAYPLRLVRGVRRLRFVGTERRRASPQGFDPAKESAAERRDRLAEETHLVGRRKVIVTGELCEVKGCGRLAEFSTGDQRLLEAELAHGRAWERGAITGVHLWCAKHYRPPVTTSARGVESEAEVTVRPQ